MNDGRHDDDWRSKDAIPGRDDGVDDAVPEPVPSQPYPGVQGGVPFHHEQEPDAEEEGAARVLRVDPDLPIPELRPGTLGDLAGHGLLMVVRDAKGAFVDADGTWRPDDTEMSLDAALDAFPEGSTTTFVGVRIEGRDEATAEDVQLDVVVRRVAEYAYDDGVRHIVVSFVTSDLR